MASFSGHLLIHVFCRCCCVQKFTIELRASNYNSVLSIGSNSTVTVGSNAVTIVGGSSSTTGAGIVRDLPVSFVYASSSRCRSYGDPHITTFDKLGYGFQVPGDYYLVRSMSGDFVVQVRQYSCKATTACNKQVAVKYGSSVLSMDVDNRCVFVLRLVCCFVAAVTSLLCLGAVSPPIQCAS